MGPRASEEEDGDVEGARDGPVRTDARPCTDRRFLAATRYRRCHLPGLDLRRRRRPLRSLLSLRPRSRDGKDPPLADSNLDMGPPTVVDDVDTQVVGDVDDVHLKNADS